jgi:hypothetical protein
VLLCVPIASVQAKDYHSNGQCSYIVTFSGSTVGQMGRVALSQWVNIHFSMERGMRIMNQVQICLCIRESYQQLKGRVCQW